MAKTKLNASDGVGFLRAFCDNWRDVELEYAVFISMSVQPGIQKGVLEHRLVAFPEGDRRAQMAAAAVTVVYPNSMVLTYEAFLFQAVVSLERVLRARRAHPSGVA